jgi:hypothetical protein
MPKGTSPHVSLREDLDEFVRQEVADGGCRMSGNFVRSLLRERRAQKLRRQLDAALVESLQTPAEEVNPEYLAKLRREAHDLIARKEAGRRSETRI